MEGLDLELVLSTTDPAEIIQFIKNNRVNGLYFLDIELEGGYNGLEVAQSIRQHDPRGFIVFITSHPDYLPLTFEYQIEALHYIQKADDVKAVRLKLCKCIKNAYHKHVSRSDDGCYIFKTQNGQRVSCEHKDMLFFEIDPHDSRRVILHTKKKQHTFYGALNQLSKKLPQGLFFRCHKSYIVNVGNLTEACIEFLTQGKDKMIMSNGCKCSVAARRRKELLKQAALHKQRRKLLNPVSIFFH